MRFSILTVATTFLLTAVNAVPATARLRTRQASTASERLGLKWLGGGNSTLPKILYVIFEAV